MPRAWGLLALIGVLGAALAGCSNSSMPSARQVTHCTAKVIGHACLLSSACIPPSLRAFAPKPAPPRQISAPPEPQILSRFAIFRRPVGGAGQPRALSSLEPRLRRDLFSRYELSRYYPGYIRQLSGLGGADRYFVVPAFGRREAIPPSGCFPPGMRSRMAAAQRRRMTEPVYCMVGMRDRRAASAPGCEPFAAIDESGAVFGSVPTIREPIVELVPDGVAAVRISYLRTPPKLVPVHDNAFTFRPPPPTPELEAELELLSTGLSEAAQRHLEVHYERMLAEAEPTKVEWLDAAGKTIRAIPAPPPGASPTSAGNLSAPIGG